MFQQRPNYFERHLNAQHGLILHMQYAFTYMKMFEKKIFCCYCIGGVWPANILHCACMYCSSPSLNASTKDAVNLCTQIIWKLCFGQQPDPCKRKHSIILSESGWILFACTLKNTYLYNFLHICAKFLDWKWKCTFISMCSSHNSYLISSFSLKN